MRSNSHVLQNLIENANSTDINTAGSNNNEQMVQHDPSTKLISEGNTDANSSQDPNKR